MIRYLLILLLLIACAKREDLPTTAPWITKGLILYPNRMESTPVVWRNQVLDVISNRERSETYIEFAINGRIISSVPFPGALISAIVIGKRLYIVGSAGVNVAIYYTEDLRTIRATKGIITAPPGQQFFNTSIAKDATGYVMAVETSAIGSGTFNPIFYHSTDLINWTQVGGSIGPGYAACPTIRYINGTYYVFWLKKINKTYITVLSRSINLVNWEESRQAVLVPNIDEGQNNSDLDLVEFAGTVYISYDAGNQDNDRPLFWEIKRATYNGSLASFVQLFF